MADPTVTGPQIDAIVKYAERYEPRLFATLVNGFDAMSDLTVITNVRKALNLTKLKAGKGARPFTSKFEAGGSDLSYTGRKLVVEEGKRELYIDPSIYRDSWMTQVRTAGINPMEIPFAAFVWQQVILELLAEINDHTIYNGFDKADAVAWASGDTYTAGDYVTFGSNPIDYYKALASTSAGESPDTHPAKWEMVNAEAIAKGLGTLIAEEITASNLTPVTTGALSASNAYEQFTAMWRSLPIAYRKFGATIYCSWNNSDFLQDDIENKVGKYVEVDDREQVMFLRKTGRKCVIKPVTWMGDSGRLIATPQSNLLLGTDAGSDFNQIRTIEDMWTLQAGINFALGLQIRDLEALRVNDQV